jgi:alpha-beta hydrolase superfamily lysophospholipase
VTKEPATDRFAARFQAAGLSVLAFDFRRFGESGGRPRQIVRIGEQLADFHAALAFARGLPEVDPGRVALWGFSLAGGHVFRVAADDARVAAAIAQAPLADGRAAAPNALRHMTPGALTRLSAVAVRDAARGLLGREPLLIPVAGERGSVASLTTPDAREGAAALDPEGRHPDWQQAVAARVALRVGAYRPGRAAARVRCPLLVVAYDDDRSALPGPAIRAGSRAPRGEVVRLPGSHYAAFLEQHEPTVAAELDFLGRHVASTAAAPRAHAA